MTHRSRRPDRDRPDHDRSQPNGSDRRSGGGAPPRARSRAHPRARPRDERERPAGFGAGAKLFSALMLGGVLAAGVAYGASAAWFDMTGRAAVTLAGGPTLAPPKASVLASVDGARATFTTTLQTLAADEDMLAPVAGDGLVVIKTTPLADGDTHAGCAWGRCVAGFRDGGRWVTVSWPAAIGATDGDMKAFTRAVMTRWSLRAHARPGA